MLGELRISNLALAEDLVITLGAGLTVLTGETGAGKSLIAGALSLICGAKVDKDIVRPGADEAWVEGVFDLADSPQTRRELAHLGVLTAEDDMLVLRRQIRREERSRVLINGAVSSLSLLQRVGPLLLAVQSQDQQRELADGSFPRRLLDDFLGHGPLLKAMAAAHRRRAEVVAELAQRRQEVAFAREQLDMWRYQHDELTAAGLDPEEELALADKLNVARHATAMQEAAARTLQLLSDGEWNAQERLGEAIGALAPQYERSRHLTEVDDHLSGAAEAVADAASTLRRFLDELELDPRSLDALESRQALYAELQRKYACDTASLLLRCDELALRLQRQEEAADDLTALEETLAAADTAWQEAAEALHQARQGAAPDFARRALARIRPLALPDLDIDLVVEVQPDPEGAITVAGTVCTPAGHGADGVRLRVRTNPGQRRGEVAAIASGGERSRIHLGLTAMAYNRPEPPLLLLDEIDAGLGMDTAAPVARLLQDLATAGQVVCITHLPTMAVHGTTHLAVRKQVRDGDTRLRVIVLDHDARVAEIARLLGGEGYAREDRDAQLSYARQLLASGGAQTPRSGSDGTRDVLEAS